jgi:hypothetical protein
MRAPEAFRDETFDRTSDQLVPVISEKSFTLLVDQGDSTVCVGDDDRDWRRLDDEPQMLGILHAPLPAR